MYMSMKNHKDCKIVVLIYLKFTWGTCTLTFVSLFCVSLFSFKVTYLHLSAGEKRKFENMGS